MSEEREKPPTFGQALGNWALRGVYRAITGDGIEPIEPKPKRPSVVREVFQTAQERVREEAVGIGTSLIDEAVAAGSRAVRRKIGDAIASAAERLKERGKTVSSSGTESGRRERSGARSSGRRAGQAARKKPEKQGPVRQIEPPRKQIPDRVRPTGEFEEK